MSKITEIKQKQQDGSYKSFNISADTIVGLKNADWNQNDSAAADYIKNRTHYINGEEYITLVNKTLGASDWKNESTSVKSVSYNLNLDTFMDLKIGDIIYIDFNNSGTETGYAIKIDTKGNYFCGNGNLEDNNMENSGEDFCIILKEEVAE